MFTKMLIPRPKPFPAPATLRMDLDCHRPLQTVLSGTRNWYASAFKYLLLSNASVRHACLDMEQRKTQPSEGCMLDCGPPPLGTYLVAPWACTVSESCLDLLTPSPSIPSPSLTPSSSSQATFLNSQNALGLKKSPPFLLLWRRRTSPKVPSLPTASGREPGTQALGHLYSFAFMKLSV